MLRLLVEQLGVGVVLLAGVAANGMLQQRDRLRRPIMRLAAQPIGVFAADFERVRKTGESPNASRVPARRLLGDLVEPGAFDRRRGAEEELRR